jgi:hypothetical protein
MYFSGICGLVVAHADASSVKANNLIILESDCMMLAPLINMLSS